MRLRIALVSGAVGDDGEAFAQGGGQVAVNFGVGKHGLNAG